MACETFWQKRTPMETALLLILIVTITFLLIMAGIYLILTLGVQLCIDCTRVCTRSLCFNREAVPPTASKVPFLAAVLEDIHYNDIGPKRYLCAGAIVSYAWVLTSTTCLKSRQHELNKEIYGLFVRIGSEFWYDGGSLHEIERVATARGVSEEPRLAALKSKELFPLFPEMQPLNLLNQNVNNQKEIYLIYGWPASQAIPFEYREKNAPVSSKRVNVQKCYPEWARDEDVFCTEEVKAAKIGKCVSYRGGPVMKDNYLLGIQIYDYCPATISIEYFIKIESYIPWLNELNFTVYNQLQIEE